MDPLSEAKAIELGRRAVRCMRWRWMPGMLWLVLPDGESDCGRKRDDYDQVPAKAIPDLEDPATKGCVLELVRQTWFDPFMTAVCSLNDGLVRWRFDSHDCPVGDLYDFESESEALVTALEQAGGLRRRTST